MRLWDLEGDKAGQATLLQSGGGGNFGAVIAPDGRTFLVVQGDGTLVEWDIASAKPLRTMPLGELGALALAPDGRHLAATQTRGPIYILRLR